MAKHKVAVLGPIPYDHITTHHGQVIIKYGCALHPAIGLSRLLGEEGEVVPVTHMRRQDEAPVLDVLAPYPNIDTSSIHLHRDQGDVIELKFVDQNNRLEKQTAFMPPISPEDVAGVLDADAFVCVPISDYEVPLPTLMHLHQHRTRGGIIIFDAHGPTTTVTTRGERFRRFWLDRDLWLPYIDILKMNIEEAGCSWFKKEYEPEDLLHDYTELTEAEMAEFAQHVLAQGVKALFITLDARGCMVYYLQEGKFCQDFVPSLWVDNVVDTTGCGDSFAGGLAFGLLGDHTAYRRAAQYANALGARRTQGTNFEVFWPLAETREMMQAFYKDKVEV